jgi:ankyrin repeat protein
MDSQARGLGYGFWMAGTRQLKNERLANFLFDRATFVERQEALEQGLAAACAMAPLEAVRALLDGGARAAPPKATQTLLPLTVAVQHGRIEVAQLLLQRGADPRQRAWADHPRALQVAQGDPSLTALLQRDVDPQDSDAVLVPEDGTWQLQSIR